MQPTSEELQRREEFLKRKAAIAKGQTTKKAPIQWKFVVPTALIFSAAVYSWMDFMFGCQIDNFGNGLKQRGARKSDAAE